MVPIPHFDVLAVVLVCVGIFGAFAGRDRLRRFLGSQVLGAGAVVMLLAHARYWGNLEGHVAAAAALVMLLVWLCLGLVWALGSRESAP